MPVRIPSIRYDIDGVPGPVRSQPATAEDFGAGTGLGGTGFAALGQGITQVGDAMYKRDEQADLSQLHAKIAKAQADWTLHLHDTLKSADPNDRGVADRYLQQFDQFTDGLSQSAQTREGQNFLAKSVADLRGDLAVRAVEGQSKLQGEAAVQNYTTTLDQSSSALVSDPSQFGVTAQRMNSYIDSLVSAGSLSQQQAIPLRTKAGEQLAVSAVDGWNRINPQYARQQLQDGLYDKFLPGPRKAELDGKADTAIKAIETQARLRNIEAREAKHEAQAASFTTVLTALGDNLKKPGSIGWDTGAVQLRDQGPNLSPGDFAHAMQLLKVQTYDNIELKDDPVIVGRVIDRIQSAGTDPRVSPMTDADLGRLVGHGVSFATKDQLAKLMEGSNGDQHRDLSPIMTVARKALENDPFSAAVGGYRGYESFNDFRIFAYDKYRTLRAAGMDPQKILASDGPILSRLEAFKPTNEDLVKRRFGSFTPDLFDKLKRDDADAKSKAPPATPEPGIISRGAAAIKNAVTFGDSKALQARQDEAEASHDEDVQKALRPAPPQPLLGEKLAPTWRFPLKDDELNGLQVQPKPTALPPPVARKVPPKIGAETPAEYFRRIGKGIHGSIQGSDQ